MAAPVGPKKVHRYTLEFKIQAVKLANHPEIQTQDVAHALDIHPFMLSKWKKAYREGRLKPAAEAAGLSLPKVLRLPKADPEKRALKRQVKQLEAKVQARREVRSLERKLAALEVEHDLLKKAIRFNIERRRRSSSSWPNTKRSTPWRSCAGATRSQGVAFMLGSPETAASAGATTRRLGPGSRASTAIAADATARRVCTRSSGERGFVAATSGWLA